MEPVSWARSHSPAHGRAETSCFLNRQWTKGKSRCPGVPVHRRGRSAAAQLSRTYPLSAFVFVWEGSERVSQLPRWAVFSSARSFFSPPFFCVYSSSPSSFLFFFLFLLFPPLPPTQPFGRSWIFGSGNIRINLDAISLFLCRCVRLDFYFHQSRLRAVFILEDGFWENVCASIFFFFLLIFIFLSFFFFLFSWYMGLAEIQTSKLNKKCFCSFPHRSSILTTAKKS